MSDVQRVWKINSIAFYRVISDLNISDELKALLLLKFYDETDMVANMSTYYLDEMELAIWHKYYDYDESFKLYFDDIYEGHKEKYGKKIDWIIALNKLDSSQLDIQRNNKVAI